MLSSVEVEDSRLVEEVDTGDVDKASEVETTVIVVGLDDDNSETSICDDFDNTWNWEVSVLEAFG